MSKIKIICDSLCDLDKSIVEQNDIEMIKSIVEQNDIEMIPLTVIIGEKEYRDGIDISKDDFYKMLRNENVYPKTSQVTYGQFKEIFGKYNKDEDTSILYIIDISKDDFYKMLRNENVYPKTSQVTYGQFKEIFGKYNKDEDTSILYIAASSSATGTCQSAIMAKNDMSGDIRVFDSQQVCYGIARYVIEAIAIKLREEGKTIDEIVEALEAMKEKVFVMFCTDTLEYLQKGGRISSTKAAIGNILNIKPILYVKDGLVSQLSQVRGKRNLVSKMVELTKDECGDLSGQTAYVGYTDNDEYL